MSYRAEERIVAHSVDRIELTAHVPFDELRDRIESLLPEVDGSELDRLVVDAVPWEQIARIARRAPYDLMRSASTEFTGVMRLAGVGTRSVAYDLTNHALLARAFRHDPGVVLALPFRVELHESAAELTGIALDRPGSRFASFGNNKITQVGVELDRAVGDLLEAIDLPRPSVLRR